MSQEAQVPDFESIKLISPYGADFWSARDLAPLLGYDKWQNFEDVISRAKTACQNAGQVVEYHFTGSGKMVKLGSGAERKLKDYALSSFACYLVVQQASSRKPGVASALAFFSNFQESGKTERVQNPESIQEVIPARADVVASEGSEVSLTLFKPDQVRRLWYEGAWYFAVIDVVAVLTDSKVPRRYWSDLKNRLREEAGETEVYAKIVQLKLPAADGKLRETDLTDSRTLLRIIQSIPSPLAEPFKQWLARTGEERAVETTNPEGTIERMRQAYRASGRDEAWINTRIHNAVVRNELTDEWDERGANTPLEYARLTNVINQNTFGLTVSEHKNLKGLKRENLRDHETHLELALTTLGEATTTALHRSRDTQGFSGLEKDAGEAGKLSGKYRREIEKKVGAPVASPQNFLNSTATPVKKVAEKGKKKVLPAANKDSDGLPLQDKMFEE